MIFEGYGWSPADLALADMVRRGGMTGTIVYVAVKGALNILNKLRPADLRSDYEVMVLDVLRNTKNLMTAIDLPHDHPDFWKFVAAVKNISIFTENLPYKKLDLASAVDKYAELIEKYATVQEQREQNMLQRLNPALVELLRKNPELLKQLQKNPDKPLRVGLFLGAIHTGVPIELSRRGETVTRQHEMQPDKEPLIFSYSEEALRAYRFGQKPSREVLTKALITQIIMTHVTIPDTHTNMQGMKIIRQIVDTANPVEFYKAYVELSNEEFLEWLRSIVGDQLPKKWFKKRDEE